MSAKIISGKDIARAIRDELNERVAELASEGLTPGLATVLAGDDPASRLYVGMKNRAGPPRRGSTRASSPCPDRPARPSCST